MIFVTMPEGHQTCQGDRADHYHVLYAAIGPDGRAASSKNNHLRDELIGRQLEIAFGEPVLNGAHGVRVAAILRERGQHEDAARVPLPDWVHSP